MKRFILGLTLFILGFIGVIFLIAASIASPLNPCMYGNSTVIEGWFAVLLTTKAQIPFYILLALTILGGIISIKESYKFKE